MQIAKLNNFFSDLMIYFEFFKVKKTEHLARSVGSDLSV